MKNKKNSKRKIFSDEALAALIEEATVDTYDEDEARVGFLTMLQDNLKVPFPASLDGEPVTVSKIDGNERVIKAVINQDNKLVPVDILDLDLDYSKVQGSEWIAAYRKWEGK